MAKLLTGTRVYGTANVDNILTVGNITPVNSTSNTTGSLIVTGGVGVTGNIFLSSANTYGTIESFRLGWTDNYFTRNSTYGGLQYTGTYLAFQNSPVYVEGTASLVVRTNLQNDTGNRRVTIKDNTGLNVANIAASTSNITGALIVAGGVGVTGNVYADGVYDSGIELLTYFQGIDNTQNTTITAVNQFAQSAYNKANTGTSTSVVSGLLPNSVLFANTTGYLANTSNIQFFAANNTFVSANIKTPGLITLSNTASSNTGSLVFNASANSIDFIFS